MGDLALLVDLHKRQRRLGPGGDPETLLAIDLSGLRGAAGLKVADIGCGTGASSLLLARELGAAVTAVDLFPAFLSELERRADAMGVAPQIQTLAASMDDPPFQEESLDAIWSEGAIYNIGFDAGLSSWRRYLKPGGVLAVSDLTWLTQERPEELNAHWNKHYPQVDVASAKLKQLEANSYAPIGYFALAENCWLENYYHPLQDQFDAFLARHGASPAARAIVEAERAEIDLYERFSGFVSYGFFVARKVEG